MKINTIINKGSRAMKLPVVLFLLLAVFFTQCKKDKFQELPKGICPEVLSVDPANGDSAVSTGTSVHVKFNKMMDTATINDNSFFLTEGTNKIMGTVTAHDSTATFKPASPLMENTVYTGTITNKTRDPQGNYLPENYVWSFSTGKNPTIPIVISTDPANLAINVVLNKTVTATFNEAMNPLTLNNLTFTLKEGTNVIAGVVSYAGMTASFNPANDLVLGKTYTATITTDAQNIGGSGLANDYIWTFSTGALIIPTVISTDPSNGATNVVLAKTITANFSVPMDPATINNSTFTLKEGANVITGVVSYTGTTASFNPTNNLVAGKTYTATITTGAQNMAGTALANDYVWTFSTGALIIPTVISTDPTNNANNVVLNKTVTATFSIAMDPASINNSTFTLKEGLNVIAGVVSYAGTTASFNPTNNLVAGKTYTATITTGAQNLAGTNLANDYVWTFSTAALVPPTVTSTDPANNATNVALNKTVTATFSTAMDPATINNLTFTLKEGLNVIAGAVSYTGTTATFNPTNDLVAGKTYTGTITTGAQNLAGTGLANNYVWTFSTAALVPPTVTSTDPANNANNVVLNKTITASFSTAMDPATINNLTFTIKDGANPVAGAVSYLGTTATFNPTNNLVAGKTYTGTITTGAENLAGTGLANNYVWTFSTAAFIPPIDLKSAEDFGIIAGTGVSNNAGFSEIRNMNVGISPGARSSITGFPPAIIVNGVMYASDDIAPPGVPAMLIQAKQDLTDAYLDAEGTTMPAPASVSGDLGGTTLAPGVYKTNSTLLIQSGNLTLDGQGDPNATWIFQIASGFTTVGGAGGSVILIGGAQAKNVYWQVGSSATIGDNTSFKGNVLALTSITMNSGAVAEGRMLAINGAVVMTNTNIINKP